MHRFRVKWGLVIRVAIIVAPLVGLKALFHFIKDMDNPFKGHATVDLSLLYKLDDYLGAR
jgi:hypothetical protein